ncbi:hypothetical protein XaCFBP7622_06245 [Xanthomonas arboricola]|nr:hypothetical protein XaCFBP7622_06245 [Xanthomonas arboricola]
MASRWRRARVGEVASGGHGRSDAMRRLSAPGDTPIQLDEVWRGEAAAARELRPMAGVELSTRTAAMAAQPLIHLVQS